MPWNSETWINAQRIKDLIAREQLNPTQTNFLKRVARGEDVPELWNEAKRLIPDEQLPRAKKVLKKHGFAKAVLV